MNDMSKKKKKNSLNFNDKALTAFILTKYLI